MRDVGVVERAFQLASSCGSLPELEKMLAREGYTNISAHLGGRQIRSEMIGRLNPQLKAQLNAKFRAYRAARIKG